MQGKVGIAFRHFMKKLIGFVNTWSPPFNVMLNHFTDVLMATGSIGLIDMRRRRNAAKV